MHKDHVGLRGDPHQRKGRGSSSTNDWNKKRSCGQRLNGIRRPTTTFPPQSLHGYSKTCNDQDVAIWQTFADPGVHTGCLPERPIPDSGVWTLHDPEDQEQSSMVEPEPFLHCEGNWQGANEELGVTHALINKEVGNGWVKAFPGTFQEAEQK